MAVLKQNSPTAWPVAPQPPPSSSVPSASTRRAVGAGSDELPASCLPFMRRVHSPGRQRRQRTIRPPPAQEDTVLRDQINDAVKTAMKSQDKLRLSTLRMVNAAIKNADIEAAAAGRGGASRG